MSFAITAAVVGAGAAIGGAAIAADSAEDQQEAGFAQTQRGVNELQRLRDSRASDPRLGFARMLAESRLRNPNPLGPEQVALLKAQNAGDANRAFTGATDAIRARAGASGSGRSGTTLGAQGRAAQALGGAIAQGNRDIDIRAAQSALQGEQAAMALFATLLGLEEQPTRDIASAYAGQGAQTLSAPSPWAGFFNQTGQQLGAAFGTTASQLQLQQQQAQEEQYAALERWFDSWGNL